MYDDQNSAGPREQTREPRKYVTRQEMLARTGWSPATLARYMKAGRIPFLQPGGRGAQVLFPLDALEAAQVLHLQTTIDKPPVPVPRKRPGPQPKWRSLPT